MRPNPVCPRHGICTRHECTCVWYVCVIIYDVRVRYEYVCVMSVFVYFLSVYMCVYERVRVCLRCVRVCYEGTCILCVRVCFCVTSV